MYRSIARSALLLGLFACGDNVDSPLPAATPSIIFFSTRPNVPMAGDRVEMSLSGMGLVFGSIRQGSVEVYAFINAASLSDVFTATSSEIPELVVRGGFDQEPLVVRATPYSGPAVTPILDQAGQFGVPIENCDIDGVFRGALPRTSINTEGDCYYSDTPASYDATITIRDGGANVTFDRFTGVAVRTGRMSECTYEITLTPAHGRLEMTFLNGSAQTNFVQWPGDRPQCVSEYDALLMR